MIALEEIGEKLASGEQLDPVDMDAVVGTNDLIGLGLIAEDRRRNLHGDRATFVRVQGMTMTSKLFSGIQVSKSAGELRIMGDLKSCEQAVEATQTVVEMSGSTPVTGFSLENLAELCQGDVSELFNLLVKLKQAGLSMVAGAQVDIISDQRWLKTVGQAGLMVARLTVGDYSKMDGLTLIKRVISLEAGVKYVQAFAPLPRDLGPHPTTGYSDLRQVALARVLVDNIDSIQVDWELYGPKLAQVALSFGADDIDSVSAVDTLELGVRRAPLEEIKRNISSSGLVPIQRDGCFRVLEKS